MASLYDSSLTMYRKLLEKKMQLVVWNQSIWAVFMGQIGKGRYDKLSKYGTNVLKPTGKPIEVKKDFMNGGLTMDIPVRYPLTEPGVAGGKQLLGNEEQIKLANKSVSVNQIRHGVLLRDNKMSKQALQEPAIVRELMGNASAELTDWYNRWLAFNIGLTFLQGYAEHQTRSTTLGGLGTTKKSHMNTYIQGSGRVSFSTTHATYEAAVATALAGLVDASQYYMNVDFIRNLVYVASHNHRIQPLTIDGQKLYPIVISDAAARQLQKDTEWKDAHKYAAPRSLTENPLFSGKIAGVVAGAMILVDETLPSAYVTGDTDFADANSTTADSTGVQYGKYASSGLMTFMASPVDTGARKPAILFGQSAVAVGVASDVGFETETWDYGQKKTEGGDMICGMEIADIIDSDGYFSTAGNKRYENISSLVGWTYSPSDASWA